MTKSLDLFGNLQLLVPNKGQRKKLGSIAKANLYDFTPGKAPARIPFLKEIHMAFQYVRFKSHIPPSDKRGYVVEFTWHH